MGVSQVTRLKWTELKQYKHDYKNSIVQGKQKKKKKERRNIITRTGSNIYFSP